MLNTNLKIISQLADYKRVLDDKLKKAFPDSGENSWFRGYVNIGSNYDMDTLNKALLKPANSALRGGKSWRPYLCLVSCQAVGGSAEDVGLLSIIPEMLHAGSLVIDDIEDNSPMRRGKPSLHSEIGLPLALNTGNALYYMPLAYAKASSLSDSKKVRIYEIINDELLRMHFGQATDIYWQHNPEEKVTEHFYLSVAVDKTGSLARLSVRLGAISGNASTEQEEALTNFAESLGIVFQISDDVLNFSDGLGKKRGEDITEGKRSLPMVYFFHDASEQDNQRMINILQMHTEDQRLIEESIRLLNKYDAISKSRKKAEEIAKQAIGDLGRRIKSQDLINLISFALQRDH